MITFPASMRVFERGWLSSHNVLFIDDDTHRFKVDSGYAGTSRRRRLRSCAMRSVANARLSGS